ncbi:MAG: cytochrome c-type biogenesis protein CcmH [Bacteroidetes bacterium]|nr:cytochrome c-type biogenesis protein CcmH [Bacteroidota bacterium]
MLSLLLLWMLGTAAPQTDVGSAHSTKLNTEQATLFNKVSDGLICQCGCNLVVSQCGHVNCPSAVPIRASIETMILDGKSETQIFDYFMTEYSFRGNPPPGRSILSQPATEGFDLIAWIAPFAILLVAGIALVVIIRRSSGKTTSAPPGQAENNIDSRIEEELKQLD